MADPKVFPSYWLTRGLLTEDQRRQYRMSPDRSDLSALIKAMPA